MDIKRAIEINLLELISTFPAVAILDPGQVGKTTLAKKVTL